MRSKNTFLFTFFIVIQLIPICTLDSVVEAKSYPRVNGYMKNNGAYVSQYNRSKGDKNYNNNWSVKPNINPYKGNAGSRQPTWNNRRPTRRPY